MQKKDENLWRIAGSALPINYILYALYIISNRRMYEPLEYNAKFENQTPNGIAVIMRLKTLYIHIYVYVHVRMHM